MTYCDIKLTVYAMAHFTQNTILGPLFRFAATLGVSGKLICDEAGLDLAAATATGSLVPSAAIIDAVECAGLASGYPNFGLLMAERVEPRIIGMPALAAEHCRSIAEYYALMQAHLGQHTNGYGLTLDEDISGGVARLRIFARGRYPPRHFAEAFLAIQARGFRQFLGADWRPRKIFVAHSKLGTVGDYARSFGTDVVFEAGQNAIVFSAEDLLWRAAGGTPDIAQPHDLAGQVSTLIQTLLPARQARIEAVAEALMLTPRTLQRRLGQQGTSFSDLLADIRLMRARDYLGRQSLSATETAARLGFGDLSALSRFLRQNGAGSSRSLMKWARP